MKVKTQVYKMKEQKEYTSEWTDLDLREQDSYQAESPNQNSRFEFEERKSSYSLS